jgi:hypothetical protein
MFKSHSVIHLSLAFISLSLFGCDFLNTASEITFGAGSLPAMEQQMEYPSVDQLVGLSESNEIPGLPNSLNQGTMAHLVGALGVSGECGRSLDLDQGELGSSVTAAEFMLAACTEDQRCSDLCPEDFLGLNARTRLEVIVMQAKQAQEIAQLLSEDSADAIVQVRFQIKALDFYQGEGSSREVTNQHIQGFEMLLGTPGVEPVLFLGPQDLSLIRESALKAKDDKSPIKRFERYELPRNHPVTEKIISDILEGNDVIVSVEQRFKINRDSLYDLKLAPAGMYQSLQPEVVINAIEATTSTLNGN